MRRARLRLTRILVVAMAAAVIGLPVSGATTAVASGGDATISMEKKCKKGKKFNKKKGKCVKRKRKKNR